MKSLRSGKGIYIAGAALLVAIAAAISVALSGGHAGFAALLSEPFFKPIKSAMTSLVATLSGHTTTSTATTRPRRRTRACGRG